jgi:D-3-phosphoglycerate dehydrogenase
VPKVLITEEIARSGLDSLAAAGHEVVVRLDLGPDALLAEVTDAAALIVRSATDVTAEVLAAASELVVVGRAGIGLDNVDVESATKRGVVVVNAPQSNALSAAEHTMGLLLAQARNIPQAHAALVLGRWERSRWQGVELSDKTLGIIGLGRIGRLVAQRAMAFGMRLVAYDPFVSAERARQLNVELLELPALLQRCDFVTLHLAKTPETIGLIGSEALAMAKPGMRLINVARGGIVDEAALADAISSGHIGGAALDVFESEPLTESPLFELPEVVVTPHLGASTVEAQDKAGTTIAEQVMLALAGEFVPFAVNVAANEASEMLRPFLPLCEQLGGMFASLSESLPDVLEIEFSGEIGGYDNKIGALSVLIGLLRAISDQPVSYVNALDVAADRGLEVRSVNTAVAHDYLNMVTVSGGGRLLSGTLTGIRSEPRLVRVDDHSVNLPPASHMLVVRNEDRPGMIGLVGRILGDLGVNIADMSVGQSEAGASLMVISADRVVPPEAAGQLVAAEGIEDARIIGLVER